MSCAIWSSVDEFHLNDLHRFMSVTDRFLAELGHITAGQVSKDIDLKYENLVKALRHIKIKVNKPDILS